MKRAEIFVCLPNFSGGGAEKVMVLVARHLSSVSGKNLPKDDQSPIATSPFSPKTMSPNDVTCVVLANEGPLKSVVSECCDVVNLRAASALRAIVTLVKLFRNRKPQIVISTLAYFNFVIVMALIVSGHVPQRTIVREANIPNSTLRMFSFRYVGQFFYKWLYNRTDVVICNSRETNDELLALGVQNSRLKLIPNPVDVDFVRKQASTTIDLPNFTDPSLPFFVSVGRLTKQKGMDRLINWVASMSAKANLLIIGQGQERDELERLIENNDLNGRIKIIDFRDNPFPYMASANAVLLGSRWEGLPNVALEAIALGKQVVATINCGGLLDIKHLLDDQALFIAGDDEEFVLILDQVARQHHATSNKSKTSRTNNKLANSKLPSEYDLNFVMEKYEAAIFGR